MALPAQLRQRRGFVGEAERRWSPESAWGTECAWGVGEFLLSAESDVHGPGGTLTSTAVPEFTVDIGKLFAE